MLCVKCGNFYGKILHVIPKGLVCCFVTKKFDFLDFGVRDGDKMAERAAPFNGLRPFLRCAVSMATPFLSFLC